MENKKVPGKGLASLQKQQGVEVLRLGGARVSEKRASVWGRPKRGSEGEDRLRLGQATGHRPQRAASCPELGAGE